MMYNLYSHVLLSVGIITILTTGVYSGFCRSQYTVSKSRTTAYTTGCGWWGKRCTRYRTYYVTESKTNPKTCCPGYTGSQCNIPVCNNPKCANNAVCTSPNNCYCRPGSGGYGCAITYCPSSYDCYPGTCYNGSDCRCASGFSGSNCLTMLEGGTFKSCKGKFEHTVNREKMTSVIGDCGKRSESEYTYFSNIGSPDYLHMDYELYFQNPPDLPPIPSQYIVQAPFGLIGSHVLATLYNSANQQIFSKERIDCNIEVAAHNKPPSASNPHQSLTCKNVKYRWESTINHKYELKLEIISKTGGFKEKKNPSTGVVSKQTYTGKTSKEYLNVKFDLNAPIHCSETNTCANEFELSVSWIPDLTTLNNPKLVWFGWTDPDSGIKEYCYTVYSMEVNSQETRLTEVPKYMTQAVWLPGTKTPSINLTLPGMYSVILKVTDNAGNIAKSRSVLLFDNVNKVEKQENFPITVSNAEEWNKVFWMTKTSATVIVRWGQRYINKFHHNNKLLIQVKPMAGVLDDSTGNRTIAAIDNYQGVVKFKVAYNKDNSGGAINKPTGHLTDVKTAQSYTITEPKKDGDTFVVFVKAIDALGNTQEDRIIIHIDTTLPTYSANNTKFTKNAPAKTENNPYVSILNLGVFDLHSGIKNITYIITDTTSASTVYNDTLYIDEQAQSQLTPQDSYCIPLGSCFTTTQQLILNNCHFKGRMGHSFKVDYCVFNGAGLKVSRTYNLGILSRLSGIDLYPNLIDVRILDDKEFYTKVTLAWNLQLACYEKESIEIVLDDGSTKMSLSTDTDKMSYELTDLKPDSSYTIDVYVVYEGGKRSAKSTVSYETGGQSTGMGIGIIIAIAVGAIVFILVVIGVVICILLIFRRRQAQPNMTEMMTEATRMITAMNRSNQLENIEHHEQLALENVAAPQNNMLSNIAYAAGYDEDDDMYIYGSLNIDTQWNVSEDKLEMQGPLPKARGKFADLKLATLHDKYGQSTIVAKLNKAGASDEAKLLMTAKMNFLADEKLCHENIVKFIGAIQPPQGPLILLEYCENGKLSDWLKHLPNVASDVEYQLVSFGKQVATAMQHLHKHKLLHRRLGSRNVLLKDNGVELVAKVTGFGPLKGEHGGTDDSNEKERVPVKWLAPEQLIVPSGEKREYTTETDVWTFGITLHEIFNKGEWPYLNMDTDEMKLQVKGGYRMPKSDGCPEYIYNKVMMPCWESNPDNRPDFDCVVEEMKIYFDGDQDIYEIP